MDRIELKSIIHSKRANLFYLEKCKVLVKDGRIVYLTQDSKNSSYWNIPAANTTVIILGTGTSITNAAVRLLVSAGVSIGFSGNDCTPLFAGAEIEWVTPQNEYRPTEYVQGWLHMWFDEDKRLQTAKYFQTKRVEFIRKTWTSNRYFTEEGISISSNELNTIVTAFETAIGRCQSVTQLLTVEAAMTKALYKEVATITGTPGFVRDRDSYDAVNRFLNHGNYLAYGLAACVLWVLGIPHAFAVMHGKTRKGALVFDVADLVKDAVILPAAFIEGQKGTPDDQFRNACITQLLDNKVMDYMFTVVETAALKDTP